MPHRFHARGDRQLSFQRKTVYNIAMKFFSPYQHMIDSASQISDSQNAKLLLRHSIRFDNPVNGDYTHLLLTPEGMKLARQMGAGLDRPVGVCAASKIKRCIQTIQQMCEGLDKYFRPQSPEIFEDKRLYGIVGNPSPIEMGGVGWYTYFDYLQQGNIQACRGITMDMEIKPILDAIFSEGGTPGTIDLYCTHDSHIIIAASALFDLKTGPDGHDWCEYAEGLFFTGTRDDFTAFWRGQKKRFVDYLI